MPSCAQCIWVAGIAGYEESRCPGREEVSHLAPRRSAVQETSGDWCTKARGGHRLQGSTTCTVLVQFWLPCVLRPQVDIWYYYMIHVGTYTCEMLHLDSWWTIYCQQSCINLHNSIRISNPTSSYHASPSQPYRAENAAKPFLFNMNWSQHCIWDIWANHPSPMMGLRAVCFCIGLMLYWKYLVPAASCYTLPCIRVHK